MHSRTILCACALALTLAGCASTGGTAGAGTGGGATAAPTQGEPPAPSVNLSGFPLPYRQGYADGCASATGAERKDAARFGGDGNYRTGWQDGLAICRKK